MSSTTVFAFPSDDSSSTSTSSNTSSKDSSKASSNESSNASSKKKRSYLESLKHLNPDELKKIVDANSKKIKMCQDHQFYFDAFSKLLSKSEYEILEVYDFYQTDVSITKPGKETVFTNAKSFKDPKFTNLNVESQYHELKFYVKI